MIWLMLQFLKSLDKKIESAEKEFLPKNISSK